MTAGSDDNDDYDISLEEDTNSSTGAVADSGDLDERLKDLPRILRYAAMIGYDTDHVPERLIAEIEELCPGLSENRAFSARRSPETGKRLANALDHRAAALDKPELRSLADGVRLISLPTPTGAAHASDHRRVGRALMVAFWKLPKDIDMEVSCGLERFVFAWAALPSCADVMTAPLSASQNASYLGDRIARHQVRFARHEIRASNEAKDQRAAGGQVSNPASSGARNSQYSLVVGRLSDDRMKDAKLREVLAPLKGAINQSLPLIEVPDLRQARAALAFEFPYATDVIDFALSDLIGRATVHLRPLLLVGDVGGGKTRFARRLGEVLGLPISRYDASRADGAVFGGTDRRWLTAEPCHPFLAVARGRAANPMVLIDEIDKPATRNDYGRLWDCLLGFLEPETNVRYPDPALQIDLDLSQVSYAATANEVEPLPLPIRDRFRIIRFPKPGADHLEALLPAVTADLAKERGYEHQWMTALGETQVSLLAHHWKGGSVRKLRQLVEALLREHESNATRH